jgi:hypothetical protein
MTAGKAVTARSLIVTVFVGAASLAGPGASSDGHQRSAATRGTRTVSAATCAMDQGVGLKSRRRFCDVVIASAARESVMMTIPAHTGPATLMFDLHNRFPVPPPNVDAAQVFTRQTALVAVIQPTGEVIDRAAVSREYRSPADLFDRIAGAGRGAPPKVFAPGHAQPVRITIPAGVAAVGIVGMRLEEWRATGRGSSDAPNRPIAFVSNLRIEYRPR